MLRWLELIKNKGRGKQQMKHLRALAATTGAYIALLWAIPTLVEAGHTHYWNMDLYLNGNLTVTGTSSLEGAVTLSSTLASGGTITAPDNRSFVSGTTNPTAFGGINQASESNWIAGFIPPTSNIFAVTTLANAARDALLVNRADPTLVVFSAASVAGDSLKKMTITHDQADGIIRSWEGDLNVQTADGSGIVFGNTMESVDGESLTLVGDTIKYIKKDGNAAFIHDTSIVAGSVSPGASGPTQGANNRTAFWLLDATNEFLYFTADIHSDSCWDGGTLWVEVTVILTVAETVGDEIDATLEWESYAKDDEDQSAASTETRSVDHSISTDNVQWTSHLLIFVLTPATTVAGEQLAFKFYLDDISTAPPVGQVGFVHADIHWRSVCPTGTRFTTIPAEG